MSSYMGAPTPLGVGNSQERNSSVARIVIVFIIIVAAVSFFASLSNYSKTKPYEGEVKLYLADIYGNHIKNTSQIPEEDIARYSEKAIYIRRSAVSADSTYIYIPEWKVKIIKPGSIKNFAYAFDGQKLYFYGTASDVDANGASGDVAFGNIEGTYIGYLEVETNQTWKEEFSIFEIDDEQFLRYYTNEKVNDATGNEAYIKLRDGTTTEFRDHFGDTRTYLNFEANDED